MNAIEKYRPQWFYVKPQGVQEEPFDVPFSFSLPPDGNTYADLPIQMVNEECIIRAIFFNVPASIGVEPTFAPPYFLMRLRDTYGNPTSDVPTLNCGGWANAAGDGCGFPVEAEIRCAAGGVVLADIAISNMGQPPGTLVTISGALRCVRRRTC